MKTSLPLLAFFVLQASFVAAQKADSMAKKTAVVADDPYLAEEIQLNRIEKAKALFEQGLALMKKNHWSQAEKKFRNSNDLVNRSSSLFNLALCLTHQGRARESLEVLSLIGEDHENPNSGDLLEYKQKLTEQLLNKLGTLRLDVYPGIARIAIDDRPIEKTGKTRRIYLNPGDHIVIATAEGFSSTRLEISIEAGKEDQLKVFLSPERVSERKNATSQKPIHLSRLLNRKKVATPKREDASDSSGDELAYWIVGGVGCATLIAAGITTLAALEDESEIDRVCPGRTECSETDRKRLVSLEDSRDALFLSSDILLGSGIVLLGTSVVWWLFQIDSDEEATRLSPHVNVDKTKFMLSLSGYL